MTTFPFASPWSFSTGGRQDGFDVDPIRAVGENLTGATWIMLAVPRECASVANRRREGKGFADFPLEKAIELLRASPAWRDVNGEAVARLTPDLLSPPAVEPELDPMDAAVLDALAQARAENEAKRRRVEIELRRDTKRTDAVIAVEASVSRSLVRTLRRKLEATGDIPRTALSSRTPRPRPKTYAKRRITKSR
jgi:hypothetical protein